MAPPKQPPKAIPGFAVDSDDEVRRRSSKPDRTVRSSTHPLHPPPSFLIQADSDDGAMGDDFDADEDEDFDEDEDDDDSSGAMEDIEAKSARRDRAAQEEVEEVR